MIELKFILKISTLVLTQPDRLHVADQLLLKLSCDQDFPSDCFEFWGMWNIIGKSGDQNNNNKSCMVYKSGNYDNRLIIDMLIAKKNSGLVF